MGFGIIEILIIVGIIILLAGGKRLPELGSSLAKAIKGFKRTMKESDHINVTPQEKQENGSSPDSGEDRKDAKQAS